jgi:hypothetical protein
MRESEIRKIVVLNQAQKNMFVTQLSIEKSGHGGGSLSSQ